MFSPEIQNGTDLLTTGKIDERASKGLQKSLTNSQIP
jgi:hypothetical protein